MAGKLGTIGSARSSPALPTCRHVAHLTSHDVERDGEQRLMTFLLEQSCAFALGRREQRADSQSTGRRRRLSHRRKRTPRSGHSVQSRSAHALLLTSASIRRCGRAKSPAKRTTSILLRALAAPLPSRPRHDPSASGRARSPSGRAPLAFWPSPARLLAEPRSPSGAPARLLARPLAFWPARGRAARSTALALGFRRGLTAPAGSARCTAPDTQRRAHSKEQTYSAMPAVTLMSKPDLPGTLKEPPPS
jgi:hypothetical protein